MSRQKKYPVCFGDLDTVFPLGKDGLRHSPDPCMECLHKVECLRNAIKGPQGLQVREEHVDRAYDSGMIGFWQRWSRRKDLERRKQKDRRWCIGDILTCRRSRCDRSHRS